MYRFEKAYLKKNKYFGGKMKILDLSFVKAYMWEYWVSIQYYIFKKQHAKDSNIHRSII